LTIIWGRKTFAYSRLCFIAGAAQVKDDLATTNNTKTNTRSNNKVAQTTASGSTNPTYAVMRMLSTHPLLQHTQQQSQSQQPQPRSAQFSSALAQYSNNSTDLASTSLLATNGPKCPHCGKVYSNASNLRQHVRNVHVSVDKSMWHMCPTCGKKLKTKHYLINHQLQAHGIHQRVGCLGLGMGYQFNDDNDNENA
jgi:uncharacterized C2H2 Zn-finger protein